jgi:hypothetical protein
MRAGEWQPGDDEINEEALVVLNDIRHERGEYDNDFLADAAKAMAEALEDVIIEWHPEYLDDFQNDLRFLHLVDRFDKDEDYEDYYGYE